MKAILGCRNYSVLFVFLLSLSVSCAVSNENEEGVGTAAQSSTAFAQVQPTAIGAHSVTFSVKPYFGFSQNCPYLSGGSGGQATQQIQPVTLNGQGMALQSISAQVVPGISGLTEVIYTFVGDLNCGTSTNLIEMPAVPYNGTDTCPIQYVYNVVNNATGQVMANNIIDPNTFVVHSLGSAFFLASPNMLSTYSMSWPYIGCQ